VTKERAIARLRGLVCGLVAAAGLAAPCAGLAAAEPPGAPTVLIVATPRGESRLPVVSDDSAGPGVSGDALVQALNGSMKPAAPWVEVSLARQSFRFLLGVPLFTFNDRLQPLAGWARVSNDSLYLPLQFVTEILPQALAERYQYDSARARLVDVGPPAARRAPQPVRLPNGLLPGHLVTIDPGHGGDDAGNPGLYFPRGVHEKEVTLQVGMLLRQELLARGIKVVMTRTTDVRPPLLERAGFCTQECDLFVSLHVDALDARARRRYGEVSGFHTIIIGEENTEDADRIATMENDALRFEDPGARTDGLDFILRNLQMNEYLRESARAAELVQEDLDKVHTGDNRGVKQSNRLAVLNTARRPAILVEMGFSTNPRDARLLTNRKSQQAIASAIADAIVAYLLEYERKAGVAGAASGR
jgi:N-acetylmuramoyl-L-alanine amidase